MLKSHVLLTGLAICLAGTVLAQNQEDALRYSRTDFGGTARVQALAGAQTALGADISNIALNPAGLGLFRRSEFSFTPALTFNSTESTLANGSIRNSSYTDNRNNLNFANFGVVFAQRKDDDPYSDWKSGGFGISFTRINSFQSYTNYQGSMAATDSTSLLNALANRATNKWRQNDPVFIDEVTRGTDLFSIESLAYYAYLIDYDSAFNDFVPIGRRGNLVQGERIEGRGAQNQWDFAYGASFQDKLYIGGGLGLTTFTYRQRRTYTETEESADTYFRKLTLQDDLTTTGAGINLKAGFIYRPTDAFRFGASIQTPTFYSLHDNSDVSVTGEFDPGYLPNGSTIVTETSVPVEFDYNLTTPFRANGGIAVFAQKYGFLTADIEYVNYSQARMNSDLSGEFNDVNNIIRKDYGAAVNYRIGVEGRMDIFRGRLGFGHYGDPFKTTFIERNKKYYTGGIGIKRENVSFDVALVHSRYKALYSPYTLTERPNPVVTTTVANTNLLFTVGLTF